jgi:uncharacterized UPF0160 family protein
MTTIVTHNGHFHADELLAVATLLLKYPEANIVRTRDEAVIAAADIVVDVGHIYDPAKMRFDHHMPAGAGKRDNGIPYASFGLIWKELGEELAGGKEEGLHVEEKIVMSVDALDNGVNVSAPLFGDIKEYSIGDYFESFAYGTMTLEDSEREFFRALPLAQDLVKREIESARTTVAGWREVRRVYAESENKRIIVLPATMSWKKVLIPSEAHFVVYPRTDGLWGAQAIPKSYANPFDRKTSFPESWGGLGNGEMARVSGVPDAVFCHRDRWLANAKSKEGALKLAEIALNS